MLVRLDVHRLLEAWRIEILMDGGRRLGAASDKLDDATVIHHNAATGALRKDCDRVLNPHSHRYGRAAI
jgi:hypothetical protein